MKNRMFFDIHCHAHTLSHPSFLALIQTIRNRRLEAVYSQLTAPEYLVSSFFHRGGEKLRNMLSVMENEPGDIFMLMEDDLAGAYLQESEKEKARQLRKDRPAPLISQNKLKLGGKTYDRLAICPLLMDFNTGGEYKPDTYYNKYPRKSMKAQIVDVLMGIREYRKQRPDGLLEVYPFLGVNPGRYSLPELERFLAEWFPKPMLKDQSEPKAETQPHDHTQLHDQTKPGNRQSAGLDRRRSQFADMIDFQSDGDFGQNNYFAGIKLYPPLGFDPWPSEPSERKKAEALYQFCETNQIPITTHCDDGGFRVIQLEKAWAYTAPERYMKVLKRFPNLRINFAHLGYLHNQIKRINDQYEWRNQILAFMLEYPNVYSDFSFDGVYPQFYQELLEMLVNLPERYRKVVEQRVMFGSDFMVNLLKVNSYLEYFTIFDESPLEPALKHQFGSENPARFLFGA